MNKLSCFSLAKCIALLAVIFSLTSCESRHQNFREKYWHQSPVKSINSTDVYYKVKWSNLVRLKIGMKQKKLVMILADYPEHPSKQFKEEHSIKEFVAQNDFLVLVENQPQRTHYVIYSKNELDSGAIYEIAFKMTSNKRLEEVSCKTVLLRDMPKTQGEW